MEKQPIMGLFSMLMGLVLLGFQVWFVVRKRLRMKRCTASTRATLVGIEWDGNRSNNNGHLVVQADIDGETRELTDKLPAKIHKYRPRIGQEVEILYDPAHPETFCVTDNHWERSAAPLFIIVGLFLLIGGYWMLSGPYALAILPYRLRWWFYRLRMWLRRAMR